MYFTRSCFFFAFCETFLRLGNPCAFLQDSKKVLEPFHGGWFWRRGRGEVGIGLTKDANCQKKPKNIGFQEFSPNSRGVFAVYHTLGKSRCRISLISSTRSVWFAQLFTFKKPRIKTGSKQIDLMGNKATCDIWPKIKEEGTVCVAIVFFALPFRV